MSRLYYLVGPPGSGKRTVGKALSALTGAALLDNHLANDPVFTAFGLDGLRPVADHAWPFVARIRAVIHEAALAAPPEVSHIFTHYLANLPGEAGALRKLRELAEARGALFVPVWLTCPLPELERRVVLPERGERLKLRDPAGLRDLLERAGTLPPPPDALVLNTATLEPAEAARQIVTFVHAPARVAG